LASAAALTFAAVSPVSSFSTSPFVPTWPPIDGSRWGGAGWVWAAEAVDCVVLLEFDVAALATTEPPRAAAPIAAIAVSLLRSEGDMVLIL
jgi:hypothetical protein